jgi:hypothetical protein
MTLREIRDRCRRLDWLPTWSRMKRLGTIKLIKSAYFWVFFLPIVIALLPKEKQEWLQRLPFSWQLWFFASCAFSAALFCYSVACPRIVRDFDRFEEFHSQGRLSPRLLRALDYVVERTVSRHAEAISALFRKKFTVEPEKSEPVSDVPPESREVVILPELQSEAFWFIRDLSDCCAPIYRLLCFSCYCLGFFFAGIIALENVYAVLKMSL